MNPHLNYPTLTLSQQTPSHDWFTYEGAPDDLGLAIQIGTNTDLSLYGAKLSEAMRGMPIISCC